MIRRWFGLLGGATFSGVRFKVMWDQRKFNVKCRNANYHCHFDRREKSALYLLKGAQQISPCGRNDKFSVSDKFGSPHQFESHPFFSVAHGFHDCYLTRNHATQHIFRSARGSAMPFVSSGQANVMRARRLAWTRSRQVGVRVQRHQSRASQTAHQALLRCR